MSILVWPPPRRKSKISVAIPASLTSDLPHLRDKSVRAGIVARAAALFRVEDIYIYLDRHGVESEGEFLCKILNYLDTPQYLRKRIYPISPFLKYAGILPPLKAPHHTVSGNLKTIGRGEFREGVVVKSGRSSLVDVGLGKLYPISKRLRKGSRVTVRLIKRRGDVSVKLASKEDVNVYWGYTAYFTGCSLHKTVSMVNADMVLATSKYGEIIYNLLDEFSNTMSTCRNLLILFGSPHESLFDICKREGVKLRDLADYIVNTIPLQGCETVRTEEALLATLSIINLLSCSQPSS